MSWRIEDQRTRQPKRKALELVDGDATFIKWSTTIHRDEALARAKRLRKEGWRAQVIKLGPWADYTVMRSIYKRPRRKRRKHVQQ